MLQQEQALNNETIEELLQTAVGRWLLQKNEGKEITFTWYGGGDEGCGTILIDDQDPDSGDEELVQFLEERLLGMLEYGCFSGDFDTSGTLTFDPVTGCFEGTDEYSESEVATRDVQLRLAVPTNCWFDRVLIQFDGDDADVSLIVDNGPFSKRHEEVEEQLSTLLCDQLKAQDLEDFNQEPFEFRPQAEYWLNPHFDILIDQVSVNDYRRTYTGKSLDVLDIAHKYKPATNS